MSGRTARAMAGHNILWLDCFQGLDGTWDDRLKQSAAKMETANDSINGLDTCQGLGMKNGVDDARVTTAGNDYQSFVTHVDDGTLIIHNQWIRFPIIIPFGIMNGKTWLERKIPAPLRNFQFTAFTRQQLYTGPISCEFCFLPKVWW